MIQLVTEPTVETPTLRPLRSSAVLIDVVVAHDQREQQRRPRHGGDALHRRALDDEGETGAGAERDIDAVGGHRLLQPRIAAEAADLDLDAVLLEDAGALADVGRHERERLASGLADAQCVGGERRSAARAEGGYATSGRDSALPLRGIIRVSG